MSVTSQRKTGSGVDRRGVTIRLRRRADAGFHGDARLVSACLRDNALDRRKELLRVTAPLDVSSSTLEADPEAVVSGSSLGAVQGRSLGQIAWMRFKRDKVAMGAGIVVALLILMAIFAPLLT